MPGGSRPGYHELRGVLDPEDPASGKRTTFYVSVKELEIAFRYTQAQGFGILNAVRVLRSPGRIYRKIHPGEDEDRPRWSYVGKLEKLVVNESSLIPFPSNSVYAVFVSPNGVVYESRVEDEDPSDPGAPLDAGERFGDLAWKI